jgi:hypothetical protein
MLESERAEGERALNLIKLEKLRKGGDEEMRWLTVFGHACLILGCYLVAWGINL